MLATNDSRYPFVVDQEETLKINGKTLCYLCRVKQIRQENRKARKITLKGQ